jgi:nicotinate dehydrogenase subunit A
LLITLLLASGVLEQAAANVNDAAVLDLFSDATMAVMLTVNGQPHVFEGDGSLPLIFALRNELGLKGVRFGCGGEDCGACTVIVDGELCYSCTTSLDAVAGRRIDTVDGITGAKANLLREAFISERAGQCGYCLSGIFTTAYALLQLSHRPTRVDVVTALSRNLCRCGSHASIIRAIETAIASVWAGGVHE